MSLERRTHVARLWGIVALGVAAWLVVRCAVELAELWVSTKQLADPAVLEARMSQLKPHAFKFPLLGWYLSVFAVLGVVLLAGLWWRGVRDAVGDEDPPTGP
jgi:hypothetical protein